MSTDKSGDIAIIGMAGIFPRAEDIHTYWRNILSGVDSITDPPPGQIEETGEESPEEFGFIYSRRGGYLGDLARIDPIKYGVVPYSLKGGDPDHFMALVVAEKAMEDAGLKDKDFPRERTEVILGHGTYVNPAHTNLLQHGLIVYQTLEILRTLIPHMEEKELDRIRKELKESLPPMDSQVLTSVIPNIMAGRVAHYLDLMGPSYLVDAACSSSLIALDLARRDLLTHRCDIALVGGVQSFLSSLTLMAFSRLGALSRSGCIRPFDRRADGTILGEGAGILVLKRREEAEKEGDRIYAFIKGIGISSDGKSRGLLAPRMEGEILAMERAYKDAGVPPESIQLIEAHGTGIPLGDVTEVHALRRVFGDRRGKYPTIGLGSVKSMIGHALPAAGIAGVIKVVLALHHRILPPTLNCEEVNPDLELDKTPFYILTEARPWIHSKRNAPRRAGVSSFGFGGINAHCILEEAG